jgi:flavin reductase (DIM6/NTAB) family NADH-FMN oxidoreductase RutF
MKEIDRHQAFELASPFPYVLAVTLDKRDRPNIIGLSWWMFTSWDPLMIAIAVGRGRYSHECLEHHGEFVLCFPSEGQEKDAWLCGKKSGSNTDKFKETGFRPVHSKTVKPPMIEGSTVAYECIIKKHVETGDHTLFVSSVVGIHGNPEKVNHIYTVHYNHLVSIGSTGSIKTDLEYE